MIKSLIDRLRRLERALAAALLIAIVALVFVASSARYLGTPLIWSIEITQALFVWLCVLAADLTLQRAGHFSVDALANLLPPRARLVLDVFNILLVGALLALLVWYGVVFAEISYGRPLPMTGVTSATATAALPIGFALMLITLAEQLVARLHGEARKDDEPVTREVM